MELTLSVRFRVLPGVTAPIGSDMVMPEGTGLRGGLRLRKQDTSMLSVMVEYSLKSGVKTEHSSLTADGRMSGSGAVKAAVEEWGWVGDRGVRTGEIGVLAGSPTPTTWRC